MDFVYVYSPARFYCDIAILVDFLDRSGYTEIIKAVLIYLTLELILL